jgi:hypothetical protein
VLKAFRKIFRAFLWSGSDSVHGSKCLVAWYKVQHPLKLDGLGVHDLKLMRRALRLHWLWFSHTDPSRPWSSMPVTDDALTQSFFRASVIVTVRNDKPILFWTKR